RHEQDREAVVEGVALDGEWEDQRHHRPREERRAAHGDRSDSRRGARRHPVDSIPPCGHGFSRCARRAMSCDAMKVLGLMLVVGGALACDDEPASRSEIEVGEVDVDGELDGGELDTVEPDTDTVEVDEDTDGGPHEVEAD